MLDDGWPCAFTVILQRGIIPFGIVPQESGNPGVQKTCNFLGRLSWLMRFTCHFLGWQWSLILYMHTSLSFPHLKLLRCWKLTSHFLSFFSSPPVSVSIPVMGRDTVHHGEASGSRWGETQGHITGRPVPGCSRASWPRSSCFSLMFGVCLREMLQKCLEGHEESVGIHSCQLNVWPSSAATTSLLCIALFV